MSPSEIYRPYGENNADIYVKEEFNKAVSELELLKMIKTDRLKYSDEIKKIYLLEEAVPSIYDFIQIEYGITPREIVKQKVLILLETYNNMDHTEDGISALERYCRLVRQQIEKPSFEINYLRIEANLKMLAFLQKMRKKYMPERHRCLCTEILSGFRKTIMKRFVPFFVKLQVLTRTIMSQTI